MKKVVAFWAFFDVCLLAASIITIIFSILWRMSDDVLRHLFITNAYLTAGLAIGVMFVVTFIVSVGAIVQPNHVTLPLAILNWFILADMTAVVTVGTMIWWKTLEERKNFGEAFNNSLPAVRLDIQNQFSCCGWYFSNETGNIVNDGFCAVIKNQTGCVGAVSSAGDTTLNDVFTSIYGFVAVLIGLFIGTLCVIKTRSEIERFRKIDAKRGGRGFV